MEQHSQTDDANAAVRRRLASDPLCGDWLGTTSTGGGLVTEMDARMVRGELAWDCTSGEDSGVGSGEGAMLLVACTSEACLNCNHKVIIMTQ